jgi:hypothetical protein
MTRAKANVQGRLRLLPGALKGLPSTPAPSHVIGPAWHGQFGRRPVTPESVGLLDDCHRPHDHLSRPCWRLLWDPN